MLTTASLTLKAPRLFSLLKNDAVPALSSNNKRRGHRERGIEYTPRQTVGAARGGGATRARGKRSKSQKQPPSRGVSRWPWEKRPATSLPFFSKSRASFLSPQNPNKGTGGDVRARSSLFTYVGRHGARSSSAMQKKKKRGCWASERV